jgi:hypothetical protein
VETFQLAAFADHGSALSTGVLHRPFPAMSDAGDSSSQIHASDPASGDESVGSDAGSQLVEIRAERVHVLAQLAAVEELQARINILLTIAIDNSAPLVHGESKHVQVNTPVSRLVGDTPLLKTPLRRTPGAPFFIAFDGSGPPAHPDATARAAEQASLSIGKADAPAALQSWSAAEDACLTDAVFAVARMHALEGVFARHGLPFPATMRPLGTRGLVLLPGREPRSEMQYTGAVGQGALRAAALAGGLAPARIAHFVAEAEAALARPRAAVLEAVPPAIDWQRVALGGFFDSGSVQSAADCKVRWLGHLAQAAGRAAGGAGAGAAHGGAKAASLKGAAAAGGGGAVPFSPEWSESEDAALAAAVEGVVPDSGGLAAALAAAGIRRHPLDALRRYQRHLRPDRAAAGDFTPAEDALLLRLVGVLGFGEWDAITDHLPGRTSAQVSRRFNQLQPPEARSRQAFSLEEDARLRLLMRVYGPGDWPLITAHFPGRVDVAPRDRWLAPMQESDAEAVAALAGSVHPPFCPQEDAALLAAAQAAEPQLRALPDVAGAEAATAQAQAHARIWAEIAEDTARRIGWLPPSSVEAAAGAASSSAAGVGAGADAAAASRLTVHGPDRCHAAGADGCFAGASAAPAADPASRTAFLIRPPPRRLPTAPEASRSLHSPPGCPRSGEVMLQRFAHLVLGRVRSATAPDGPGRKRLRGASVFDVAAPTAGAAAAQRLASSSSAAAAEGGSDEEA